MQQCGDCLKVYDESEYTQCPFCDEEENDEGDCPECNGTRKEECYVCEGEGADPDDPDEVCPECKGTGEIDCAECLDAGRI